jgi:predicted acetyltransferase
MSNMIDPAVISEFRRLLTAQNSALWQVMSTAASMIEPIRDAGLATQATVLSLLVEDVAKRTHDLKDFVDLHPEMGVPAAPPSTPVN